MSALVPVHPAGLDVAGTMPLVMAGLPVASCTFDDVVRTLNWCNGRGSQLVPAFNPYQQMSSDGLNGPANVKFRLRAEPKYATLERIWVFSARGFDTTGSSYDGVSGATYQVRAPHTTGSYGTNIFYAANRLGNVQWGFFRETLTAQSETEGEISIEFECTSGIMVIESVGCWEMPRAELGLTQGAAADNGLELNSVGAGQPIFADATAGQNIKEIGANVIQTLSNARRTGLFYQAWPDTTTDAYTTTSGTYVNMFHVDPIVLAQLLYRGDTQRSIKFNALVYGIGDIRITDNSSATSATMSFSSAGAWAWGTSTSLSVDCEDFAEANRLQGGAKDTLTVEARITGGTRIYVASINVWTPKL